MCPEFFVVMVPMWLVSFAPLHRDTISLQADPKQPRTERGFCVRTAAAPGLLPANARWSGSFQELGGRGVETRAAGAGREHGTDVGGAAA